MPTDLFKSGVNDQRIYHLTLQANRVVFHSIDVQLTNLTSSHYIHVCQPFQRPLGLQIEFHDSCR